MADRDYAAPLPPERRKSLWARITNSLRLTTDWDSAPPLTAGLLEWSPDLSRSRTPVEDLPPVPLDPDTLQPGCHAAASSNLQHAHTDSVQQGISLHAYDQRHSRVLLQNGLHQQQSTHRGHSQQPRPQRDGRRPNMEHEPTPVQLPPVRVHSPLWNADLYEDPRSAPPLLTHAIRPQPQQQCNASHVLYQRNSQGQLFAITKPSQSPSREHTMRRRPAQSSLRNQVNQEDDHHIQDHTISNAPAGTSTNPDRNAPASVSSYSHYPIYSPLPFSEPHTLPPLSRSSPAARDVQTHAREHTSSSRNLYIQPDQSRHTPPLAGLQGLTLDPTDPSPNPTELQSSLFYYPPDFPHIPFLPNPAAPLLSNRPAIMSNASIATFSNPALSCPPMTEREAHIKGIKRHIFNQPRTLKARVIAKSSRLGKKMRKATEYKVKRGVRNMQVVFWDIEEGVAEAVVRWRGKLKRTVVEGSVVVFYSQRDWDADRGQPHEEPYQVWSDRIDEELFANL